MKKLIFYLILIALQQPVFSQKVYFIYLQTDPQQPFYVKMNEKITSSSSSGYLILSKLIDSSYKFSIGFPDNKWPEQAFSVSVNKKDHGYLVKNFGDKGWGLFDLQTLSVQMPVSGSAGIESPTGTMIKDESVFTDILSKAADDPSLKNRPVVPKPEEKKPVAVITEPVKKEEEKTVIKEPVTKPVETVTVVKNDGQKTEIKEPIITPIVPAIVTGKTEEPKTEIKEAVVTTKEPAVVVADKKEEPKNDTKETVVKTAEIKEPALVKKEEVKEVLKDTVVAKPVVETGLDKKEEPKLEIKEAGEADTKTIDQQTIISEEYRRSEVKKRSESSTTEGFGLVFIDDNGGGNVDTIRLLIPNPRPVVAAVKEEPKEEKKFLDIVPADTVKTVETKPATEEKKPVVEEKTILEEKKPAVEEKKPAVEEKIIVEEKKPAVKEEKPVVEEKITVEEKKPAEEKTVATVVANNCSSVAAETDFFKLRKKMAGITSDDNMISEARKIFKTKCFTSLQIKNLGYLFLSDEGKYKFFDAAYGHVSDKENFQSLQSELKDIYYLARFKAMLR